MSTSVIITGAAGRMGKTLITRALEQTKLYKLLGATEAFNSPSLNEDCGRLVGKTDSGICVSKSLTDILKQKKGVIIDFTGPEATLENIKIALAFKAPLVIGSTGFSSQQKKIIEKASKKIPIVLAPNMSVGVNTLFKLVADAASILGSSYDIEITEAHHRLKKDAPSGTAVKIAEILADATHKTYPDDFNFHREGLIGERDPNEIGMQVIRGGDIVGEHTILYCGTGERLEIKHTATSRNCFADGALRAATWISKKASGLFDMRDVLGI